MKRKPTAQSILEKADKLKKRELKRTIFVPGPGSGDHLAMGPLGTTATYRMPEVPDERWDWIWMDDAEFKRKYGHAKTKMAPV